MDSKKLAIMKALTTHLEGINPDFDHPGTDLPNTIDMRGKWFRGRIGFGAETVRPFGSILEAPKPLDPNAVGDKANRSSKWTLLVQGFVVDDKENPTDPAYELLALTEARLARIIATEAKTGEPAYPEEYLLARKISGLILGEGIVRPADPQVSPTAFFYLPVTVELTTNVLNPYAA